MIKKIILKLGKSGKRIRPACPVRSSPPEAGVSSNGGTFFLFNRLLFFFPVLVKNNYANGYRKQSENSKKNIKQLRSLHYSPPLSVITPMIKKIKNTTIPIRNKFILKPTGDTIVPRIRIATTNLQMSRNVFDIFSLCFFVNLIFKNILSKAEISVKQIIFPLWQRGAGGFFGKD